MDSEAEDHYRPFRHPFVNGMRVHGGVGDTARTVVDLALSELSASLRRRDGWWASFKCPETRVQWATEALAEPIAVRAPSRDLRVWLTPGQVEYVLDELQGYVRLRDTQNNCQVSCFERIWDSAAIIDDLLRTKLNGQLSRVLETIPDKLTRRDGGALTRHIVDPYLYPLIYDRTLAYDLGMQGVLRPEPAPCATDSINADFLSHEYACLPCDFLISQDATAKALSYINNLHPRYSALYCHLEELISKCVPIFEHVLTDLHPDNPHKVRIQSPSSVTHWDEPESPDFSRNFVDWSAFESRKRQWVIRRSMEPDVPTTGYPGGLEDRQNIVRLRGRTLQVVIEAYEICIEPGGTPFQGTQWRVEGMKNENIVACVLYSSSCDNIAGSSVEFRMAVKTPPAFPNRCHQDMTVKTWGLQTGDPCHQYIGSVPLCQGRCIAFPNIYQYHLTPFSLTDPLKEGHQRIIGLYLVDPSIAPLASTRRVPPQQKAWTRISLEEATQGIFPMELVDKVLDEVDGIIDIDEALKCRESMMKERTRLSVLNDIQYFNIPCKGRR